MSKQKPAVAELRLVLLLSDLVDAVAHATRQSDRIYEAECQTVMQMAESALAEYRRNTV